MNDPHPPDIPLEAGVTLSEGAEVLEGDSQFTGPAANKTMVELEVRVRFDTNHPAWVRGWAAKTQGIHWPMTSDAVSLNLDYGSVSVKPGPEPHSSDILDIQVRLAGESRLEVAFEATVETELLADFHGSHELNLTAYRPVHKLEVSPGSPAVVSSDLPIPAEDGDCWLRIVAVPHIRDAAGRVVQDVTFHVEDGDMTISYE